MRHKFGLLASTALTTSSAVVSVTALAADMRMPVKAVPVDPPFSWSGCYAGLNAGVVWGRVHQQVTIPTDIVPGRVIDSDDREAGFIGGGQIGCNVHYARNWLFGIEGDINYVDIKRTQNFAFSIGSEDVVGSQSSKLHWLATVRGRLGYAWDRSLLYVTGGLAIGKVSSSVPATVEDAVYTGSYSETRYGWTLGAGFEQAFSNRVSAKLEYLHFDLGDAGYNVIRTSGLTLLPATWNASARVSGDIVRLGINVKLGQ